MNNLAEKYTKQIDILLEEIERLSVMSKTFSRSDIFLDEKDDSEAPKVHQAYGTTLNMLSNLFGARSPQVKSLIDQRKQIVSKKNFIKYELRETCHLVYGILASVKNDIEAGLNTSIVIQASGAVIGDFIAIAKNELKNGNKDVAAVLASAALEDSLKRKADELGIKTENKDLSGIINALKSQGFFSGAETPIISSYVKLRNSAMHADWAKIQGTEVSSLIGFLEPFLIKNFS
ncbi:hypothetical protein KKG61_06140 [bacterium]|nr:hypothetical protein [bacterium]